MLWWWLWRLRATYPQIRRRAAQRIGESGKRSAQALEALQLLLTDPEVGDTALRSFCQLGGVDDLLKLADHELAWVRAGVARQLGWWATRDQRAAEALKKLLQDTKQDVRIAAGEALAQTGDASLRALAREAEIDRHMAGLEARSDWARMSESAVALARLEARRALPLLLAALRYSFDLERMGEIYEYDRDARKGSQFSGELAASLESQGRKTEAEALLLREYSACMAYPWAKTQERLDRLQLPLVGAVGAVGDVTAIGSLIALPIEGLGALQQARDEALANIRGAAAVQEYSRLLEQSIDGRVWKVGYLAAQTLGRLQDVAATPALVKALNTLLARRDPNLLSEVVCALGRVGDERAVEPLIRVVTDPQFDPEQARSSMANHELTQMRAGANLGLRRITSQELFDPSAWKAWWESDASKPWRAAS